MRDWSKKTYVRSLKRVAEWAYPECEMVKMTTVKTYPRDEDKEGLECLRWAHAPIKFLGVVGVPVSTAGRRIRRNTKKGARRENVCIPYGT